MSQGTLFTLFRLWHAVQADLFPWLEAELGPLGERYRRLVAVLELARVESLVPHCHGLPGRPVEDRAALACAFVAKAVFDIATTRALIERLEVDRTMRRLCGWTGAGEVPSEATFSRAFAEFSEGALPARVHAALIGKTMGDRLVGHISRDATAIEAREKPRPRPRAETPKLHDSQAAIPLATMTAKRVTSLYDLMDAAYDTPEIGWHSYLLGHVPIIDVNPRGKDFKEELAREATAQNHVGHVHPARRRYGERSTVERLNAGLKDSFGARHVRVRGHAKVHCHLMFGILALTVDRLMRLLT